MTDGAPVGAPFVMWSQLLRYEAEGLAGLADAPRSAAPPTVTEAYRESSWPSYGVGHGR